METKGWYPGIPVQINQWMLHPSSPLFPSAVTLHRTYGSWVGDKHTLLKDRVPSCHFLVGKQTGNWLQMVSTSHIANHAKGSNNWSIGIEFEGTNSEPLTDWQILCLSKLIAWSDKTLSIPRILYPRAGTRTSFFRGWISHGDILSDEPHTDRLTMFDWNKANSVMDTPAKPVPKPTTIVDVKEESVLTAYPVPVITPNAFGVGEGLVEFNRVLISAQATLNGGPLLNQGVAVECLGTKVRVSCWGLTAPVGVHVWAVPAP